MRKLLGAALAASVLLCAGQASAGELVEFRLTGTVTEQFGAAAPFLNVGDRLFLQARVDSDRFVQWGGEGYSVFGNYYGQNSDPRFPPAMRSLPLLGDEYFRISGLPGVASYFVGTDFLDGADPFYEESGSAMRLALGGSGIAFQGDRILGLGINNPGGTDWVNWMWTANGQYLLNPGSVNGEGVVTPTTSSFTPFSFSPDFEVITNNCYVGPPSCTPSAGVRGVWDFEGSSVLWSGRAAVPEPSTWAVMLMGFFGAGGLLRRRKAALAA